MRRTFLFIGLLLVGIVLAFSCGSNKTVVPEPSPFMLAAEVLSDSTSSWQLVREVTLPLCDSICNAITDESNLKRRMSGQEMAYDIMDAAIDSYLSHKEAGEDIPEQEILDIINPLQAALNQWFYSPDERLPHIWKDHFYVSYKDSENPMRGFFHLIITLPTQEHPEPEFHVFYPESAADRPAFVFKEQYGEDINGDDDIVFPDEWYYKNELGDERPMYARAGEHVVKMLLSHPTMYLLFESADTPDGTPGTFELASLQMAPMWTLWRDHAKNN